MGSHCRWIPFASVPLEANPPHDISCRFLSLGAACVIGTMAFAVPTLPVQAAPTTANTIVAVASVAPQTDRRLGEPSPGLVPQRSRAHEALSVTTEEERKQRPGLGRFR